MPLPTVTEAQKIVAQLRGMGMEPADIARQIGGRSQQIRDISRGKSSGGAIVDRLRGLAIHVQSSASVAPAPKVDTGSPQGAPQDEAAPTVSLDVADVPADERSTVARLKDSVLDAMLNRTPAGQAVVSAPKAKGGAQGGKVTEAQASFVDNVAPLAAIVVVILLESSLPRLYRPIAMNEEEAESIGRPLLRILARMLEVSGQLSDTALDLLAAAGASALYAHRAWETFKLIREAQQYGYMVDGASAGTAPGAPVTASQAAAVGLVAGRGSVSGAATPAALNGHSGGGASHHIQAQPAAGHPGPTAQQGRGDGSAPAGQNGAAGLAAIDRLLNEDALGSKRLGLN